MIPIEQKGKQLYNNMLMKVVACIGIDHDSTTGGNRSSCLLGKSVAL
jgi:hypothetical protein